MDILGISCFYHDAAACLLRDGVVVAAAEEERFTRKKHDADFPLHASRYCLEAGGIDAADLDLVVFYEKPLLKLERILAGYAATFPRSRGMFVRAMRTWFGDKLWIRGHIRSALGYDGELLFGEHHLSHAASAYFPSPFNDAAVLTADGVGEWASTTLGFGEGIDLELTHEIRYPHSLGLLYSAFTAYLGFEVNEGEYKVMGMAGYGQPRYVDRVLELIALGEDGSFHLDMRRLTYHHAARAFGRAFEELFGPPRHPEADLLPRHADIAASIQLVIEEAMLGLARRARGLSGSDNLCLAGGVALNVLANTCILREAGIRSLWVQPA
ncbi:MAG TPA: carbamoyltransferase N-terminal domain-containing protein, partial [Chloroflexota bacterium]|nr:carbamoyltransferase N-terminal domain-containing protein [Chloroflexota bacterium]